MQFGPSRPDGWCSSTGMQTHFWVCSADIDMIELGFCSFGGANNPVCFSYIQRQSVGEKLFTVTYFGMQKAALPDSGGAAAPPVPAPSPVKDIPGPAPQLSQSEVCNTLPIAHIQVLTTSRRPAALPIVGPRLPINSYVFYSPTCYPRRRKRNNMTQIQVSNN
jgi:hypothetical protein